MVLAARLAASVDETITSTDRDTLETLCDAVCILALISWVTADCSSTAEAREVAVSSIWPRVSMTPDDFH